MLATDQVWVGGHTGREGWGRWWREVSTGKGIDGRDWNTITTKLSYELLCNFIIHSDPTKIKRKKKQKQKTFPATLHRQTFPARIPYLHPIHRGQVEGTNCEGPPHFYF